MYTPNILVQGYKLIKNRGKKVTFSTRNIKLFWYKYLGQVELKWI